MTDFDPPYPRGGTSTRWPGRSRWRPCSRPRARCACTAAPEALLTLADEGLLGHRPVLLNSDPAGLPAAASVVTDSLRRRVRNFGELRTGPIRRR